MYSNYTRKEGDWKKFLAAAVLLMAILIGCILVGVHFIFNDSSVDDEPPVTSGLVYDTSAVIGGWDSLTEEEISAALNEKVEEGYINISMNTSPVFVDGKSPGNLMIVNETVNRYPQKVVISLGETGETIYTSGAIPVGSKIVADALDVDLAAGTYACTAMFHSLDPETGGVLGSAGANITITVQN